MKKVLITALLSGLTIASFAGTGSNNYPKNMSIQELLENGYKLKATYNGVSKSLLPHDILRLTHVDNSSSSISNCGFEIRNNEELESGIAIEVPNGFSIVFDKNNIETYQLNYMDQPDTYIKKANISLYFMTLIGREGYTRTLGDSMERVSECNDITLEVIGTSDNFDYDVTSVSLNQYIEKKEVETNNLLQAEVKNLKSTIKKLKSEVESLEKENTELKAEIKHVNGVIGKSFWQRLRRN